MGKDQAHGDDLDTIYEQMLEQILGVITKIFESIN